MNKQIPLTYGFDDNPGRVLGHVELLPEGLSADADTIWRLFRERPELFTFEPGYIPKKVDEDGTITGAELLEISLVMKPSGLVNSKKAPEGASMALSDIIDDLAG